MSKVKYSHDCVDCCTSFSTDLTTVYAIVLLMLCLLDALSCI